MQSNFCSMGNQTSCVRPLTGYQPRGERHHACSQCDTRQQASPFPPSSLSIFATIHFVRQFTAWHKAKLWLASSSWLWTVLSASVLISTCFCRDPFAGFCFLDGGCQCFRGMKARFSGVWEEGVCWQLHFPRKRCTVQLLLYKIKQF